MLEEVIQWVAAISTAKHQPNALTFGQRNRNTTEPNIMYNEPNLEVVAGEKTEI